MSAHRERRLTIRMVFRPGRAPLAHDRRERPTCRTSRGIRIDRAHVHRASAVGRLLHLIDSDSRPAKKNRRTVPQGSRSFHLLRQTQPVSRGREPFSSQHEDRVPLPPQVRRTYLLSVLLGVFGLVDPDLAGQGWGLGRFADEPFGVSCVGGGEYAGAFVADRKPAPPSTVSLHPAITPERQRRGLDYPSTFEEPVSIAPRCLMQVDSFRRAKDKRTATLAGQSSAYSLAVSTDESRRQRSSTPSQQPLDKQ